MTDVPTDRLERPAPVNMASGVWLAATVLAAAAVGLTMTGRYTHAAVAILLAVLSVTVQYALRARRDLVDALKRVSAGDLREAEDDINLGPFLEPVAAALQALTEATDTGNRDLREAIHQERMKTLELEMLANRLEETSRQLEQANEEIAAFSYSASHDLAAPLRVIESLTAIVEEDHGPGLDDEGRKHLATIRGSAGRLIALVQDLLVLSRLKPANPDDIQEVRLGDLVRELIDDLESGLPDNARVVISGDLPTVEAPPERVRQVLQNLITNGCKFNRSELPTISIDGWTEGGIGIVRVSDNGIGIPEHAENDAFGLFTRLHRDDEFTGTGAGLAIARRSARSLGGELWIERSSPAGTTFALAIPTHRAIGAAGIGLDTRASKYLLD